MIKNRKRSKKSKKMFKLLNIIIEKRNKEYKQIVKVNVGIYKFVRLYRTPGQIYGIIFQHKICHFQPEIGHQMKFTDTGH